jgi:Holliday junction resolvase-like predicted endonuclease
MGIRSWYAALYLEQKGHIIWKRNWKAKSGQIDLITIGNTAVHLVEVKFRSSLTEHAVLTDGQYHRITKSAQAFEKSHWPDFRRRGIKSWQIDLLIITPTQRYLGLPKVTWMQRVMLD